MYNTLSSTFGAVFPAFSNKLERSCYKAQFILLVKRSILFRRSCSCYAELFCLRKVII